MINGASRMEPSDSDLRKAAEILRKSHYAVALTGAGISVESGIPDFRGEHGLWKRFDPGIYAHLDSFMRDPETVWDMVFELMPLLAAAAPNPGHRALAELQRLGRLKAVITQNIDGLHQAAGSRGVVELHGNAGRLTCLDCGRSYPASDFFPAGVPPRCSCGKILKPGFVFFGENVPPRALAESLNLASTADAILVVGTSASVSPASDIPYIAKKNGAKMIEVNLRPTGLTNWITDVFLEGRAGEILPRLAELATLR